MGRYSPRLRIAIPYIARRCTRRVRSPRQPLAVVLLCSRCIGRSERTLRQIPAASLRSPRSTGMVLALPSIHHGSGCAHSQTHNTRSRRALRMAMEHPLHCLVPHHRRHRILLCPLAARLHDIDSVDDSARQRAGILLLWSICAPRKAHKGQTRRPLHPGRQSGLARHRIIATIAPGDTRRMPATMPPRYCTPR